MAYCNDHSVDPPITVNERNNLIAYSDNMKVLFPMVCKIHSSSVQCHLSNGLASKTTEFGEKASSGIPIRIAA